MKRIFLIIKKRPMNAVLVGLALILYFCNNYFFKKITVGRLNFFMICYFNDLICPLFFLAYTNILLLSIGKELTKIKWILSYMFFIGMFWELIAPIFNKDAVTDVWDLGFYMCGSLIYWMLMKYFQNKPQT